MTSAIAVRMSVKQDEGHTDIKYDLEMTSLHL